MVVSKAVTETMECALKLAASTTAARQSPARQPSPLLARLYGRALVSQVHPVHGPDSSTAAASRQALPGDDGSALELSLTSDMSLPADMPRQVLMALLLDSVQPLTWGPQETPACTPQPHQLPAKNNLMAAPLWRESSACTLHLLEFMHASL